MGMRRGMRAVSKGNLFNEIVCIFDSSGYDLKLVRIPLWQLKQ
jgi:hypothetical protein